MNSTYINHTRAWLEKVVIGLNLCPFARKPYLGDQVRFVVSEARDTAQLLTDLENEIQRLIDTNIQELETTVLIHPLVLTDFLDYNDFLDEADQLLQNKALEGAFQIASLHPDYQFADTQYDDAENFTNRSPYPVLHILREESVTLAIGDHPSPDKIPQRNIRLMDKYGNEKMRTILHQCQQAADD
ncbi:MAG: DUF1415 domain-containing protein [Gammaproteobacteria bacterium]|nr:DUF1415 domain-containing protein [Gammaproteobacteria bacterium]